MHVIVYIRVKAVLSELPLEANKNETNIWLEYIKQNFVRQSDKKNITIEGTRPKREK